MTAKLYDSELKVMELLWDRGEMSASELARLLKAQTGWSRTTSYTVIKKCLDKGALQRLEPGFVCRALVTRQQVQADETDELIDKLYGGAPDVLISSLLDRRRLSREHLASLRRLVERLS